MWIVVSLAFPNDVCYCHIILWCIGGKPAWNHILFGIMWGKNNTTECEHPHSLSKTILPASLTQQNKHPISYLRLADPMQYLHTVFLYLRLKRSHHTHHHDNHPLLTQNISMHSEKILRQLSMLHYIFIMTFLQPKNNTSMNLNTFTVQYILHIQYIIVFF